MDANARAAPIPLLGSSAAAYVDALEADRRVDPFASEIARVTNDERRLGLCAPPESREDLDRRYGVGNWRPTPRHVIFPNSGSPLRVLVGFLKEITSDHIQRDPLLPAPDLSPLEFHRMR